MLGERVGMVGIEEESGVLNFRVYILFCDSREVTEVLCKIIYI